MSQGIRPSNPTLESKMTPILSRRVSMVTNARATKTRTITLEDFLAAVEKGHWQKEITAIRKEYRKVLKKTGSQAEAKKAIAPLKKKLPAVMLSGEFVEREDKKLKQHSGM